MKLTLKDGKGASSGAFDLSGRFPLGVDPGGRSDENTVGQPGGHRWHGQTENNHPAHPNHRHAYATPSDKVDAGQDGTEQAWDASPSSDSWTGGIDHLLGGSGDLTGHLGPYNSGDNVDRRNRGRHMFRDSESGPATGAHVGSDSAE